MRSGGVLRLGRWEGGADASAAAGHPVSARKAYLRATTYCLQTQSSRARAIVTIVVML
jgi:hypothetical protein